LRGFQRLVALPVFALLLFGITGLFAFQANFRQYPNEEDNPAPVPSDAFERTEWAYARLRYPSGSHASYSGDRGSWPTDYPKADRQFVAGVRRLTRLSTRSTEQVIELDTDEIFNWPWTYAVEVGHWELTDKQCKMIREYLLRGGFLMVDDFHGTYEWEVFMASMGRIFPDRPVVEIEDGDPIFHVLYDIPARENRLQVPGLQYLYSGKIYEKDGKIPHWRAIYDDDHRIMVAMTFNQDHGDAFEHADNPQYEMKYTSQAYRTGINYIIYAMTH
jgi:hypothetical protein